jgi:hypothetical protein
VMLRRFVAGLATVAVVVALLVACTSSQVHRLRPDSADADLVGRRRDTTGQELPDGTNAMGGVLVVSTGAGSTTCTEDHVTVFMHLVSCLLSLITVRAAQARTSRRSPRSAYDPVYLPRRPCDART